MKTLVNALLGWPERVAHHLVWLGPLFARVVVGWVFMWTGWGKLIGGSEELAEYLTRQ